MLHRRPLAVALLALSLTGLTIGCASPNPGASPTKPDSKAAAAKTVNVTGAVSAPAGVIATGGGNVISTGGGNVIGTGGLNYRHVLAVEERPLGGTAVYLADAQGNTVPGVAETTTDAKGQYRFSKVPAGKNYVVTAKAKTAEGKDAELRSILKVASGNATANLGASSTMMTAMVLEKAAGELANVDPVAYAQAVTALNDRLTLADLPDLSNKAEILETMAGLMATMAELKGMIDGLRGTLPDAAKDALDQAQKEIDAATIPLPF